MADLKVYVLCRFADHSSLYQSWLPGLRRPYEVVRDPLGKWTVPEDAGLLVTHMHYRWEEVHALRRVVEAQRVPVLILADGILEYRNLYEHPELADGSIFQPLIGHKLACIGRGQARVIEAWGNIGKCEVVGLPRLDDFPAPPPPRGDTDPFRLLIATASTPAFDDRQRQAVVESLQHIQTRLTSNPKVQGRPVEVTWRLTDRLSDDLGLGPTPAVSELPPLREALRTADAVITSPSTMYLESVLLGRPTAILDFHNTPHFVPAAWMINAPKHLNAILNELASPPAAKMLFQNMVLHDQLECRGAAQPRMLELIEAMIRRGSECRAANQPLTLPPRILEDPQRGFARVEEGISLSDLYPRNAVLKLDDRDALRLELNLAVSRLQGLPDEIVAAENRFNDLRDKFESLQKRYQDTRGRLMKARGRITRLQEELKQHETPPAGEPENPPSGGAEAASPPAEPKRSDDAPASPEPRQERPPPTYEGPADY